MSFSFLEFFKEKRVYLLVASLIAVCALLFGLMAFAGNAATDARMQRSMPLRGEHQLHRMTENGSYFIVFGDTKKAVGSDLATIKFAWKMSDGTYQVSSLPLAKIRLKFDANAKIPTIKFAWDYRADVDNLQNFMDFTVALATITLTENDWSPMVVGQPI